MSGQARESRTERHDCCCCRDRDPCPSTHIRSPSTLRRDEDTSRLQDCQSLPSAGTKREAYFSSTVEG